MANHIQFKIGSSFNGEGFKQAVDSTRRVSAGVKSASAAMGRVSSAFGMAQSAAGKAAGALSGVVQTLLTLGPAAGVVAAGLFALNKLFDAQKRDLEATEELMKAVEERYKSRLFGSIAGDAAALTSELKRVNERMEGISKEAESFSRAMRGLSASEASGAIAQLQVEKLQEMLDAHSDAERESIEVAYQLKEAQLRKTLMVDAATERLDALNAQYAAVQEQLAVNLDSQAKANESLAEAERKFGIVAQNYDVGSKEYVAAEQEVIAAKKVVASLDQQQSELGQKSLELSINKEAADQERLNAIQQGTALELQAQIAVKAKEEADWQAVQDRAREKDENGRLFVSAAELAAEQEAAAEKQRLLNEKMDERVVGLADLVEAENNYRAALSDYADKLSGLSGLTGIGDGVFKLGESGTLPVRVVSGVSMQVADARVDEAIRNGAVTTVKEADRMRRDEARQARNEMTRGSGQRAIEAQRAQRLRQQNFDTLNRFDQHFLSEYSKIESATNAQRQAVEDAKQKTEESTEAIKEIKQKIEKLTVS